METLYAYSYAADCAHASTQRYMQSRVGGYKKHASVHTILVKVHMQKRVSQSLLDMTGKCNLSILQSLTSDL